MNITRIQWDRSHAITKVTERSLVYHGDSWVSNEPGDVIVPMIAFDVAGHEKASLEDTIRRGGEMGGGPWECTLYVRQDWGTFGDGRHFGRFGILLTRAT